MVSKRFWGVMLMALIVSAAAHATTFDVASFLDYPDNDPGDGICNTSIGVCTLRAAVQQANATAGADVINLPQGQYRLTVTGRGENAAATGDLDVLDDLSIYGDGADVTVVDGNGTDRVFDVLGGSLELVNLTVRGGRANFADYITDLGGGISAHASVLSIGGCRLTDNIANQGGAIFSSQTAQLQITDSLLDGNATELGTVNPWGAAIYAEGAVSLEGTTVAANTGSTTGYFAVNVHCYSGSVYVLNSTIADNQAAGLNTYDCNTTILHTSIVGNTSIGLAMGDYDDTHTYSVANSIIAGHPNRDCTAAVASSTTFDHCLDSDDTCGLSVAAGDLPATDPELLPLRDWGGPTPTLYPKPWASPAIDAGDPAVGYITDQRGELRGGDGNGDGVGGYDMGSVEAGDLVFYDSFESGDPSEWSVTAGLTP